MKDQFEVAGGSIAGRDHVRAGRNNHDAFSWTQDPDWTIAVVADGCGGADDGMPMGLRVQRGSGPHSEVGAKIGVRIVAETIRRNLRQRLGALSVAATLYSLPFWERVRQDVLAHLRVIALAMGDSLSEVVNEHFLFTLVGVVLTATHSAVVSVGDGWYAVNGMEKEIGPFPNNQPPYLAYGLVPSSLTESTPSVLHFTVREWIATDDVQSLLIGTDGIGDFRAAAQRCIPGSDELVGPIKQFWENDLHFQNPDAVRRRLAAVNRDRSAPLVASTNPAVGLLPDDTTLIVIRRRRNEG